MFGNNKGKVPNKKMQPTRRGEVRPHNAVVENQETVQKPTETGKQSTILQPGKVMTATERCVGGTVGTQPPANGCGVWAVNVNRTKQANHGVNEARCAVVVCGTQRRG